MSLINQMLQELDARRADAGAGGSLSDQIRAVPPRRPVHPAWWIVLLLGMTLVGLIAWVVLRPAPRVEPPVLAELPLKLDLSLRNPSNPSVAGPTVPLPSLPEPAAFFPVTPESTPEQLGEARVVMKKEEANSRVALANSGPDKAEQKAGAGEMIRPAPETEITPVPQPASSVVERSKQADSAGATASQPVVKQVRQPTPREQAEEAFRIATLSLRDGRTDQALANLEAALALDPAHAGARQALVAVLVDAARHAEALHHAQAGLGHDRSLVNLAMIAARLQVEQGALRPAIETLNQSRSHAAARADYLAFLGALLQRDERHGEAVEQYTQALQQTPNNGLWWMGLAISLQAEGRTSEARAAFDRAKGSKQLSAPLQAFVDERLKQLR